MVKSDDGRTEIFEMGVQNPGFVPERYFAGGEEQHVFDHRQSISDPIGFQ